MKFTFTLLICLLPFQAFSDPLVLLAGLTVEPYIIETGDSGFEVDIVKEAFALEGYDVEFGYQPLLRSKYSFKEDHVDGVMTIKKNYPEVQGSFFSDQYITYHNFAITLRSNNLKINIIADLANTRVSGFQQASLALGKEFELMAKENSDYHELSNQGKQVTMLFLMHTDVIVLDFRIFKYYRNRLTRLPSEPLVTFHNLFEPSAYRMAFKEDKIRDAFNHGLKVLKESGRYKQIIDSYVESK